MANLRHASKKAKCRHYSQVFITYLCSHVGLCALVVGYAVIGAFIFECLESPNEKDQRSIMQAIRDECVSDLGNMTLSENMTDLIAARLRQYDLEVYNAIKDRGYDGKSSEDSELQWSFPGALLYSVTVITTIGYGHIVPKTDKGKVVTVFYALLGIPLMLLCLTNIGDLLARSFKFAYSHLCFLFRNPRSIHPANIPPRAITPRHVQTGPTTASVTKITEVTTLKLPNEEEKNPPTVDVSSPQPLNILPASNVVMIVPESCHPVTPVVIERVYVDSTSGNSQNVPIFMVLLVVTAYICGGAVLFCLWEGWTFLNGAYFCFITLSTIGFGDLVPGSNIFKGNSNNVELVICCIYLITGLSIIAMSFNLVQEEVATKFKNLGRNIGLISSENDANAA